MGQTFFDELIGRILPFKFFSVPRDGTGIFRAFLGLFLTMAVMSPAFIAPS
jgi:hypothetical protein